MKRSMCGPAGAILGKKRRRREELHIVAGIAAIRNDGDFRLFKRAWDATDPIAET